MKFSQLETTKLGVSIAISICAGFVSAQPNVDEVERSIVRVVIGGHGTGWVVSPGIVATNWHVVRGNRTFDIYQAGTDEEFRGEFLWQGNEDLDIGLIEVPGLTLEPFSLFTGDAPRGSDSYTVGFPGLGDDLTGRANTNVSVYGGTVALVTENTAGVRIIQHTNIVNAGNSGGPLLDNCGRVLGLTTWGVENEQYQADFIWASVHVSELAAQLDVLGISYERDNEPCLGSEITQQDLDALDELLRRQAEQFERQRQEERQQLIRWASVAAAAVIMLGSLFAFFVMRALRRQRTSGHPEVSVTQAIRSELARLRVGAPQRSVSPESRHLLAGRGEFSDYRATFGDSGVSIGSDSSNGLTVTSELVSHRHAQVTWDSGRRKFALDDLGSLNGTFLADGTRISPGERIWLNEGDSFYLVHEGMSFYVLTPK